MDNIEQFYRDVLPPTGNYYLAIIDSNKKISQRSFSDIDSFLAAIKLVSKTNNNVYFGTGSFSGSRTIADAKEKKCYYLDVDFGLPPKEYQTAGQAVEGINEFIQSTDVPKPSYMVTTGHGFHCYWVLDKPIPAEQWLIGARNLKQLCVDNGLHADHGVTGDAARILRAPGSINVKFPDHPMKTMLHPMTAEMGAFFKPDLFAEGAGMFPELGKFVGADDLTNLPVPEVSYSAKGVFSACGIFKRSFREGGASDTGEVWGNELLILTFTEDGEKLKHHIGKNHPDYTPASTDAKWNVKQNCGAKPTTCEFMSTLPDCGKICDACPVKGTVTTPLHLGRIEPAAPTVAAAPPAVAKQINNLTLPDGYVQNKDGLWHRTGEDEDGRPTFEPVLPPLVKKSVVDLVVSRDICYEHHYRLKMFSDTEAFEVTFTPEQMVDAKAFGTLLARKRMPLNEPFAKRFRSMIMSWVSQLNNTEVTVGQTHFGWAEDHSSFAVGDEVYANGKTERNDLVDGVMQSKYSVMGTLPDWASKANAVINDRPASAAIVAASLAAPLIGFTRDPGCVLSIHGDSGAGKTTVMKIGQTLWGHPIKSMMSLDDTTLSMLNALGIMRNLPAFWDEVRSSSADERLMQTVFRLTAGRERSRLNSNVEQRAVHEWQTILITSSNISALGTIASQTRDSDAGVMRIFELTMPAITNSLGDLSVTSVYGAAGRVYGEYLANNTASVKQQVESAEDSIRAALGALEPERFRVSLVAALVAGAQLGKQVLGLDFDIESLVKYLSSQFLLLRASSKQHRDSYSADTLLIQFINEMTAHRLVTDKVASRGRHATITMLSYPRNAAPVYVHLAQSGECLMDKPQFDEWVERKVGLKPHKTKEEMLKVAGVRIMQRSLGAGTTMAAGRGYCYIIDMTDPAFAGVFDNLYTPMVQASNVTPLQP